MIEMTSNLTRIVAWRVTKAPKSPAHDESAKELRCSNDHVKLRQCFNTLYQVNNTDKSAPNKIIFLTSS